MSVKRIFFLILVLVFTMGTISVEAAPSEIIAANQRWIAGVVKTDVTNIRDLSTAFVGASQIPLLSYDVIGSTKIYQAHLATATVPGNCGPNNSWFCTDWNAATLVPGTLSNMATGLYGPSSFGVKWAYQSGGMIRGTTVERYNNMALVAPYSSEDLFQLDYFGDALVGPPSLQMVAGHYRMAAVIRSGQGEFPTYKLVYMQYVGALRRSCKDGGAMYDCIVIDQTTGWGSIGSPSLQVAPDGTVGIAYYFKNIVKYAYPYDSTVSWPDNCGPNGDTWRCIPIYPVSQPGTVGPGVRLAFGATGTDRGIAFTYNDALNGLTLFNATYVVSDGNCGSDITAYGMPVKSWECTGLAILGTPAYTPSYSIEIDPQGYPVIAFNWASEDMAPVFLYLTYPKARTGSADPGWMAQTIDGVLAEVDTGALAALSLNSAGLGFIAYLQEPYYQPPALKFALQNFRFYLPLLRR